MAQVQSLPPGVLGATRQRGLRHLLIGIDLGAAQVKAALSDREGTVVWRERAANRGHPLATLVDTLAALPGRFRAHPMRVAVTGSGQYLLDGMPECLRVSEVLAIARMVRREFPVARTVIDHGGSARVLFALGASPRSGSCWGATARTRWSISRPTGCVLPVPCLLYTSPSPRD